MNSVLTPATEVVLISTVFKGTVEMIDSGGVGLCYSVTLTNHTTQAMHEHAVGITQLVWQCWSPLL